MFPYEDDFSCRKRDNYGKCISVEKAYEEAVTKVSQGEPMEPASEQDDDDDYRGGSSRSSKPEVAVSLPQANPSNIAKRQYKDALYKELSHMIEDPRTPMIKPPKTMRVLILPHSSSSETNVYMPRYIYTIIEPSRWVVGDYLVDETNEKHLMLDPKSMRAQ